MNASSNTAAIFHNANLRLCRIRMWIDYDGFGFILESSSKPPYMIDSVEPYSPAAAGGLQAQDAVLAINNKAVSSTDYDQVIDTIKQARDRNGLIELFVVEQRFYRSLVKRNIKFDINSANVIVTPPTMPNNYRNYLRYQPRLCYIYLEESEKQFGFDVVYGKNDLGALIEKIHPDTPASRSILRENDRIIEIKKKSVDKKGKKSIYKKLESAQLKGYVELYVMNDETYQYYQSNEMSLSSKKYRKNRSIDKNSFNNHDCKYGYFS